MPLKFIGAWRFRSPADGKFLNESIPEAAVSECIDLIMKIATQEDDRQRIIEHFKDHFCKAAGATHSWSSSLSWAETDLHTYAHEAARNAPLFIEAFYDACASLEEDDDDFFVPDANMVNALLVGHNIGYQIKPPRLEPREESKVLIEVANAPGTLADDAVEILQTSLHRSEELLSEGHGREAVQESLWLLETVSTAFRGAETGTGTVEGKYFNQIVRELRRGNTDTTLNRVLSWVESLHGYLSSPTGGGIRHGLDLDEGVLISEREARLFCNLIRSYLSFLLAEYERLS